MIASLQVPSTDTISFHTVTVETNAKEGVAGGVVKGLDVSKLPFFCQVNQINSNFIKVGVVNISHVTSSHVTS